MNSSEFTKKIIFNLEDTERRKVLNKAIHNGFTVDGFSKRPYDAPIMAINNCMNRKKKSKYQYQILMEAMSKISMEDGSSDMLRYVKKWIEDENSHDDIEKELEKMNEDVKTCNNVTETRNLISLDEEKEKYIEKIVGLEEEIKNSKERSKKQKQTIQENKIEISNLKQDIIRREKENQQKKIENDNLKKRIDVLLDGNKKIHIKLDEKEEEIKELKKNMDALQIFRDNAPKVLCISKQKEQIEIPGFDIKTIHKWDNVIKEQIQNNEYTKIWLIHNGFTYEIISEIKETFEKEKIKEFSNCKNMYETVMDGGIKNGTNRR